MVIINKNHLYVLTTEKSMQKTQKKSKMPANRTNVYKGKKSQKDNKKKNNFFFVDSKLSNGQ